MLVIADTSPFVALVNVGHVDLLPALFAQVIIPPKVAVELSAPDRPQAVRSFIAAPPNWLVIRLPNSVQPIPKIHDGEREAISLALELQADLLIIDDRAGREAAIARNLPTIRTLTILEQAANRGLLDLQDAFNRLEQTDFRMTRKVTEAVLARHREYVRQHPRSPNTRP